MNGFTVGSIEADVKRVLGGVQDDVFYSKLNHAVEILATESEWQPMLGYVDVCVGADRFITLPRDIGTVLAVNINGKPAQGHGTFYQWHLNGPGSDFRQTGYHWIDGLPVFTYLDPAAAGSTLVAVPETASDNGKSFRVFGYDVNGTWIRSNEDGTMVDGFLVPITYGAVEPNPEAPLIRRITRISKAVTAGYISLNTVDDEDELTEIGRYFSYDTEPSFRRIKVSLPCSWARVAFRKEITTLSALSDFIPLHSKYAVVLMCMALKKLDEDRIEDAENYHNKAIQLLIKKQRSVEIPGGPSVQIADGNLIHDKSDRVD